LLAGDRFFGVGDMGFEKLLGTALSTVTAAVGGVIPTMQYWTISEDNVSTKAQRLQANSW
jgi:hypothetical protein